MAENRGSALSTILAVGEFLVVVATWVFIPPALIRNAWMLERSQVFQFAGQSESFMFTQSMQGMQSSIAEDFNGYIREADGLGHGPLGNQGFSRWMRERVEASWLWIGLVAYRLHVLMGWFIPGIPLAIVAYLDGHYVREIRKYSFVAQSPIRHKLGIRVLWSAILGLVGWLLVPIPLPVLIAPVLTVCLAYALWLWVSNLQKRL